MTGETWSTTVVHADMDAFYASIEQLDDPRLRNRPVLVGPDSPRGVVLTASYEARPYKVGSAMPMRTARERCPDAIVVPPRFERYREISSQVMQVFAEFSPRVEPISLDEAFLDMSGAWHIFGPPEAIGSSLKRAIREATGGLTASVGISGTKFVAKVASGYAKPDGLTIVSPQDARGWLAPQPISVLWGAGPKTQRRLHALGYDRVGDVACADLDRLAEQLGAIGRRFGSLARGEDPRMVAQDARARSLSCERTLNADVDTLEAVCRHLRKSAETVAARLRRGGMQAGGVRVKLKRADFRVLSRQTQLPTPTARTGDLYLAAQQLARELAAHGPFRLVGLAAYDLSPASSEGQLDLLDATSARSARLDELMDEAAARFGPGAVKRARQLNRSTVLDESTNLDFLED